MTKPRYPYMAREVTRHGKVIWYFRKDGKRVRLPNTYGTKEFMDAYADALLGRIKPKNKPETKGTLKWAINQYRLSTHFQSLNFTTRRMRDNIYAHIIENSGSIALAKITRRDLKNSVDKRAKKPSVAISFLKAISPGRRK